MGSKPHGNRSSAISIPNSPEKVNSNNFDREENISEQIKKAEGIGESESTTADIDDATPTEKSQEKFSDTNGDVRADDRDIEYLELAKNHETDRTGEDAWKNEDIRYDERGVEKYTEKQYNNYGWAIENNILTNNEVSTFFEKYAQTKHGTKFTKSNDGYFIIPVGKEYGVNNTLVFAKGNILYPQIQKVIRINLSNETSIDEIRKEILYESREGTNDFVIAYFVEKKLATVYKASDISNFGKSGRTQKADAINDFGYSEEYSKRRKNLGKNRNSDRATMTTERIDYLIEDSGAGMRKDYAQSWITSINPTDFLNMTLGEKNQNREIFDTMPGDYGSTVNDYDYIEGLKNETRQTPFLAINVDTGEVVGHEGRHRMRALEKQGITSAEIRIEFRYADGRLVKERKTWKLIVWNLSTK